jgi:hypothetical protein
MGWVLRLVETETDSPGPGVEVMEIRPPRDLGDIARLGLTLPEAKQLLARVQQAVVAAQAQGHAVVRPDCSSCAVDVTSRTGGFTGSRRCSVL